MCIVLNFDSIEYDVVSKNRTRCHAELGSASLIRGKIIKVDFFPFYIIINPIIRGSSNGRTTGSGPVYQGSNPCPRAKIKTSQKLGGFYFGFVIGKDSNGQQ